MVGATADQCNPCDRVRQDRDVWAVRCVRCRALAAKVFALLRVQTIAGLRALEDTSAIALLRFLRDALTAPHQSLMPMPRLPREARLICGLSCRPVRVRSGTRRLRPLMTQPIGPTRPKQRTLHRILVVAITCRATRAATGHRLAAAGAGRFASVGSNGTSSISQATECFMHGESATHETADPIIEAPYYEHLTRVLRAALDVGDLSCAGGCRAAGT